VKHPLKFRPDGTFTIVQFTDVHMKAGGEADERTIALMDDILRQERPDLIVFTGDVIEANKCDDPLGRFDLGVSIAEKHRIPWAVVFGNHDTESQITRRQLIEHACRYEYSVAEPGPAELSGEGNYTLTVTDRAGRSAAALYFFDSGSVSSIPHVKGYGWIGRDQIGWYERQSRQTTEQNGGSPLPSLAFFHIPLPEYDQVWNREVCYGNRFENVCCPGLNTGLFAAMVDMGDVIGTFAGHDHVNDYCGELYGIRLCYGRATGYNTYGREGFSHGARIIRMREGERRFESWLRLDDGSIDRQEQEHRPESSSK